MKGKAVGKREGRGRCFDEGRESEVDWFDLVCEHVVEEM